MLSKPIHRLFILIEGQGDSYPNCYNAKVHFTQEDPGTIKLEEQFVTSPLFPLSDSGYQHIPELIDRTKITFLIVPSIIPSFYELLNDFNEKSEIWFSIGLANLIIIENKDNEGITDRIIQFLRERDNLIAYEAWVLNSEARISEIKPQIVFEATDSKVVFSPAELSNRLPLNIKFTVSEYIISVNKLLTASKKFTPHYYNRHQRTIEVTNLLINDLSFLHGDFSYEPTLALRNSLQAGSKEEAIKKIQEKTVNVENLINDKHWMIIQFNSSLSYIYSQTYAGTFPLFDHFGLVRRHSFLGLGTATAALFELIIQLEIAFYNLPFENLDHTSYKNKNQFVPQDYTRMIFEPALFSSELWRNDTVKSEVNHGDVIGNGDNFPAAYYNRLSFFSGRLGFKEYEFSATAAIQVIVESKTLPWHIINYTHEIIHNHVRTLLNQLILVQESVRKSDFDTWASYFTNLIRQILKNSKKSNEILNITYYDYFVVVLMKFILNVNSYGSLRKPCNKSVIDKMKTNNKLKIKYIIPKPEDLRDGIRHHYKDITEIFVHTIDFCYVYKQQLEIYITSVWTSWSTVPAVVNDLKQYIIRSLVVVGLTIEGTSNHRFVKVKSKFRSLISAMTEKSDNVIFKSVLEILDEPKMESDLRYRFYNCIIVGDLVYNFFIGKLHGFLDGGDDNVIPVNTSENGKPLNYYIDTNSFQGQPILSKVRFVFDQLVKEVYREGPQLPDDALERTSAWLLLLLSSNDERNIRH